MGIRIREHLQSCVASNGSARRKVLVCGNDSDNASSAICTQLPLLASYVGTKNRLKEENNFLAQQAQHCKRKSMNFDVVRRIRFHSDAVRFVGYVRTPISLLYNG
uniref:Uncharacterized protein n=1 Tax=Glossina austeni TaxID=7395 RepID=A0A1A9VX12_GLOAU